MPTRCEASAPPATPSEADRPVPGQLAPAREQIPELRSGSMVLVGGHAAPARARGICQLTVADVMTATAVTVARNTPIAAVARTLREHAIHRAWVEEDGRLCGVISTFDLLPLVEQGGG